MNQEPEAPYFDDELDNPLNPFVGLRSFEMEEEYLFFGRESLVDDLIRKLRENRFLAVLGTSGSGKSSVVRSGLVPALFRGGMAGGGSRWRHAVFCPGNDPIGNLAHALMDDDVFGSQFEEGKKDRLTKLLISTLNRSSNGLIDCAAQNNLSEKECLLVVVDQFEELFRFSRDLTETNSYNDSSAFVKLLIKASQSVEHRIFIILTMRSEFLGNCTEFLGLPEMINKSQYLIPRLNREQLKAAIEGPVAVGEATISPRLVTTLLNTIQNHTDQLPVLQHALMRTWEYWQKNASPDTPLDLPHYEAIGTMKEALSVHADEAMEELKTPRQKGNVVRIFQALTEKSREGRGTRRPASVEQICEAAGVTVQEVIEVADTFRKTGRCLLLPNQRVPLTKDTVLDISHESLMRIWSKLKDWVEQESEDASLYIRLASAAQLFEEGGGGLWRDPELTLALSWYSHAHPTEGWAKRYHPEFTKAMTFLETSREAANRDKNKEATMRRKERLRTSMFFILFGIIVVPIFLVGGMKMYQVLVSKTEAYKEERDNYWQTNFVVPLKEELEAAKTQLEQSQKEADQKEGPLPERIRQRTKLLNSPTMKALAHVQAYHFLQEGSGNLTSHEILELLVESLDELQINDYSKPAFQDQSSLANPALLIYPQKKFKRLITYHSDGTIRIHFPDDNPSDANTDNSSSIQQMVGSVNAMALQNDYLALATDQQVQVWDLTRLIQFRLAEQKANTSPDTALKLNPHYVLDMKVKNLVFNVDYKQGLLLVSDDEVMEWEFQTTNPPTTLFRPRSNGVGDLAVGSTNVLLAYGNGNKLRIHKLDSLKENYLTKQCPETITSLQFHEDKWLAAGTTSGEIYLYDVASIGSAKQSATFPAPFPDEKVENLLFFVDSSGSNPKKDPVLAASYSKGRLLIWDITTKKALEFKGHDSKVQQLFFDQDDNTLITIHQSGSIRSWSPTNLTSHICEKVRANFTRDQWHFLISNHRPLQTTCPDFKHNLNP